MKNKEPLILAVVVFFTLLTYYLVEPYAHHVMHKHVESESFEYSDIAKFTPTTNIAHGKELVTSNCTACHSINVEKMPAPMDAVTSAASYGVNPPDLSNAGVVYDAKYLAAFIADPAKAANVSHKFNDTRMHPMPSYNWMQPSEISDMVAYLQSIAVKAEDLTPAMAYENACGRCHAVHYEKWTQLGTKPSFKHEKDSLAFDIKVMEYEDSIKTYMGKLPPDLSMYIRSRNEHFISTLVENPQNHLAGTAMPRVGVSAETMEKVIEHLEDAGDAKRHEREAVGKNVMIYIVIFAIFALLWKKQVWKELH